MTAEGGLPDAAAVRRLLAGRRSVRQFKADPIDDETIARLVEAAACAPSATNRQPWRFTVVRGRPTIEAMAQAVRDRVAIVKNSIRDDWREEFVQYSTFFTGFTGAPAVLVGLYRSSASPLAMVDRSGPDADSDWLADRLAVDALIGATAAMQNVTTLASAMDLATCWMTGPLIAHDQLLEILEVPRGWRIAALMALGRALEVPEAPARRPLEKIYRIID